MECANKGAANSAQAKAESKSVDVLRGKIEMAKVEGERSSSTQVEMTLERLSDSAMSWSSVKLQCLGECLESGP